MEVGEGQSASWSGLWDNFILSDRIVDRAANKGFVFGTQGKISVEGQDVSSGGLVRTQHHFLGPFLKI